MSVSSSRSALGNAVKRAKANGDDPGTEIEVVEARRRLAEDKIREFIEKTVAGAPPLSPEQRHRLRTLFNSGAPSKGGR